MIVVRNIFIAKPGCASKLAAQLKDASAAAKGPFRYRVLTDVTGEFNRVILEYEVGSISEFEERTKDYNTNEEFRAGSSNRSARSPDAVLGPNWASSSWLGG